MERKRHSTETGGESPNEADTRRTTRAYRRPSPTRKLMSSAVRAYAIHLQYGETATPTFNPSPT